MASAPAVYFDANVLWSYAAVGRLDILGSRFSTRARWTDAVSDEIARNSHRAAYLKDVHAAAFMPSPLPVPTSEFGKVYLIRDVLASVNDPVNMHLGEAETMHMILSHDPDGIFLTDDFAAGQLAQRRGIRVMRTADVMSEAFSMSEVGCPEAYELLVQMKSAGRGVRVPSHHSKVC